MQVFLAIVIISMIIGVFCLAFKSGAGITTIFVASVLVLLDWLLSLFGFKPKYPGFITEPIKNKITHKEEEK